MTPMNYVSLFYFCSCRLS